MSLTLFIAQFIESALDNPVLVPLAITASTLLLEDPTTVIVGMMAADRVLPVLGALAPIWVGVIIGDSFLYGVGYLARKHSKLARFVDHKNVIPFRTWLEKRYMLTVFSVRFIPGLRIPVFMASGFFQNSFPRFAIAAIGATLAWSTLLFFAAYWFGNFTSHWFLWVRYGIALVFAAALFFIGRHNLRSYQAHKEAGGE